MILFDAEEKAMVAGVKDGAGALDVLCVRD